MNNLQLQQKDREKEIAFLDSFIKSDIDARELKRAVAVRMALSGNIYHEISKILGISKFFISYWKKQFKTKGIAGIKHRKSFRIAIAVLKKVRYALCH